METQEPAFVLHEIAPLGEKDCLYIVDRYKKEFTYPIHNHDVFELNYIEHAPGVKRIVGDSTEEIGEYDLVLITSPLLEHVWQQGSCTSDHIREITVQFILDLNSPLLEHMPFTSLREMLLRARTGLCFSEEAILRIHPLLMSLPGVKDKFYAFVKFYSILYELSQCPDSRTLASTAYAKVPVHSDSRRITKAQEYIRTHYYDDIRLGEVASVVGMSPTAFSRFFRLHTGKRLSDYITDFRIGLASRELIDSSKSIQEILYGCGYNNISNFNRIFLKRKGCSPKAFREIYRKKRIIV